MLMYPDIHPVALQIGPLQVRWYGVMYLVGFFAAWGLALIRARRLNSGWNSSQIADLIFFAVIGVVVGGRLGYMLFYNLPNMLSDPLVIFKVWDGGMSFHGGLVGVIVAMWLYGRHIEKGFFEMMDFVAPLAPIGLGAGRLGNFINGELWGRVTSMPWGMVFPMAGSQPRHPSQLYEFLLEGVVLFIILWWYSSKPKPRLAVSGMFLLCYGCFRIFVEFFRLPDAQLGYLAFGWVTMGQLLSIPMILGGLWLVFYAYQRSDIRFIK